MLGFVETSDPKQLRKALIALRQEIMADSYFEGVPSLAKTAVAFHAKDDLPEVRYKVFQLLATLEFKAQFIVARKIEPAFPQQLSGKGGCLL